MKHTIVLAAGSFVAILSCSAIAQPPVASQGSSPGSSTPAQLRINAANLQIQADPKKTEAYNELALALIRRAREAADTAYYGQADEVLAAGVKIAPNDFQLQKTQVALLLRRQKFTEAKKAAVALNRHAPDDVTTYGYIAEADMALGDYQGAETATQWMLNLLPYNVPGLLLTSELREVYGDADGALESLNRCYAKTSPDQTEEIAWILNQAASVGIHAGKLESAHLALDQAEKVFPGYPYTLENRAELKMAQGNAPDAISLLRQRPQTPQVLYQLAEAERAAGRTPEATLTYASFEKAAKPLIDAPANANRELILYYAGEAPAAKQALDLAQREAKVRQDVWTLDAYGWALYANGQYSEAEVQIQKALAVGVRSAQIFDHAGRVAAKLNKQADAARYFEAALQINSSPEYAQDARSQLAAIQAIQSQQPVAQARTGDLSRTDSFLIPLNKAAVATTPFPLDDGLTETDSSPVPESLLTPHPTETERIIRTMQSRVARSPKEAGAYSGLGAAFLQRARETGDVADYQLAEQSLNKSLDLVSTDLSATGPMATMAEVCMGEHRFQDALDYSQKALALGSGDLSPFAIVGDAYADMGEYEKAGAAYSRLIADSGPEVRTAYARDSRFAYLKFISGDTEEAIRLMQGAVTAAVEARLPSENLAWLYFELGEFYFQRGSVQLAGRAYRASLAIHPGDYRAMAGLGKVRANEGKYQEAIQLYQKAIAVVPMPIFVAELGDVFAKVGNAAEAEKQYQLVEYIGLLGHINQVLHNRDLALFYADHDRKLSESLALAYKEFEVRHDVYTWDALAWALYKNGKYPEAKDAMDDALHFGTNDALLHFHAGMIEAKLGNIDQAQRDLNNALKLNPQFHVRYAEQARQQLALFEKRPVQTAGEMNSHGQSNVQ